MKAAFLSLPAHGHVNPSLPLVAELVRAGHPVTYFGTEEFREKIEGAGARFHRYPQFGYDFSRPDRNLVKLGAALAETGLALLPPVLEALGEADVDCVLHDSMAPWGSWAARILGLPAVSSTPTFVVDRAMNRSLRGLLHLAGTVVAGAGGLRRLGAAARLLRTRHGIEGVSFPEILGSRGDLTLVYTSRRFQPGAERFDESVRFVGPSLPAPSGASDPLLAEIDRACAGGAPLVYVSLGTVFNDRPDFLRACTRAFAGTEAQVLVAAGQKVRIEDVGPLPPNVRVRPFVPQIDVLRRARLFVSHGGMNGVSEALCLGVPLLLYPQMSEQAMVARRVEALGAGRVVGRSALRPRALRAAAMALLGDPRFAHRARWIGESLAEAGGSAAAARLVLALVRGPTRPGALAPPARLGRVRGRPGQGACTPGTTGRTSREA
ncbi:MAG TPA: macrolide family glycosyltransferase [Anaeromyxobacteraceae bacterium]|nr:macrolide family glycosyltransferase [Anaeromyxobacteraceae bacterium]